MLFGRLPINADPSRRDTRDKTNDEMARSIYFIPVETNKTVASFLFVSLFVEMISTKSNFPTNIVSDSVTDEAILVSTHNEAETQEYQN
jgi:hypothetical protein